MQNYMMSIDEAKHKLTSVGDLVRLGISLFNQSDLYFGHGYTNAQQEAYSLVSYCLKLPYESLEVFFNTTLLTSEITQILTMVNQRIQTKLPLAYITNQAICQGYSFYVDHRVIIPRSFIAELMVNNALEDIIPHNELIHNVLDLCTGNGSLAIIASDIYPDAKIIASDISHSALEVAQINVSQYHLSNRVTLIQSDLFTNIPAMKFDLIITNPPYVDQVCMSELKTEYSHEPYMALAGGIDGLDLIKQIILKANNYLSDTGLLIIEMGNNVEELEVIFPNLPIIWLNTTSGDGFVFAIHKLDLNAYFSK